MIIFQNKFVSLYLRKPLATRIRQSFSIRHFPASFLQVLWGQRHFGNACQQVYTSSPGVPTSKDIQKVGDGPFHLVHQPLDARYH